MYKRQPETSYKIKSEIIYHNCLACGAREMCDMQHKLTTYILKQHKIEKKAKVLAQRPLRGRRDGVVPRPRRGDAVHAAA